MFRGVLAVVLATALLAATFPALEDARREHTATTVGAELDVVERAASDLLATDDVVPGEGARRVVALRIPAESWGDAGIASVTVGGAVEGPGALLSWTVAGGRRYERRLPETPVRTPGSGPVTYESAGRHRLVLTLDGTPSEPVVSIRRFKTEEGATAAHAKLDPRLRRRAGARLRVRPDARR